MSIISTYRYDEFHPFLFAQHAKSPYLEFDTFDKVNTDMAAYLVLFLDSLFRKEYWSFLLYNVNSPFWYDSNVILSCRQWMSSFLRWRVRRLTWRPCSRRNRLWRSWRMLKGTTSRDWRPCTKYRSAFLSTFRFVCSKRCTEWLLLFHMYVFVER